jgi:chemotaxis protein methyltransferase CheR
LKSEIIQISDELFLKLGKVITEKYGIKLPPDKKIMFQARLQRRLHDLKLNSFDEYAEALLGNRTESEEIKLLADYISTNKTDFFREWEHFNFLSDHVLPQYLKLKSFNEHEDLRIWSAGCSSGQEAYTIGITVEEYIKNNKRRFNYSILATDISERMLVAAKQAIYPLSAISEIPMEIKQAYFLKSKDTRDPKVRIVEEIRRNVRVAYLNLMDSSYEVGPKFDVIFLRNTLIYFERVVQLRVLEKIVNNLNTGGYLFIGHSESLINLNLPIQSVAPSVYVKTNNL